jgi:subtilisin
VVDSVAEDGAKLVEMTEETKRRLEAEQPGLRVEPVRYYELARTARYEVRAAPPILLSAVVAPNVPVKVVDQDTKQAIVGATVVAFTDFDKRIGASGESDASGEVLLDFGVPNPRLERVYVYPPLAGYWGAFRSNIKAQQLGTIELAPVSAASPPATGLDAFVGRGGPADGAGVKVGVIDTGVGPHPALTSVASGDPDNGEGHGTHVAGIVRAIAGGGVSIRSYRVFGRGALAANFSIAKAIDQAVADQCDILNLSLKISGPFDTPGLQVDPVVAFALEDARDAGCLPLAAAGNDGRKFVGFPAREPSCVAVSAVGRRGTYPAGSLEEGEALVDPVGHGPDDFIAAFSNVGPEVTVTAPGVGIVSTVPVGGELGVMSGTSMACPAVAGVAARLLAKASAVHNMPRDANRSAAIRSLVMRATQDLGFPANFQGQGLPK